MLGALAGGLATGQHSLIVYAHGHQRGNSEQSGSGQDAISHALVWRGTH